MAIPILTSLPGEKRGYTGSAGAQIHYREQGDGEPLILIHQALWSSIHYHHIMPRMAARGFRVIVPDLPGHGMSSPPVGNASIATYAAAVAELIKALNLNKVAVAGHHGGALTAARLASRYPDKVSRLAFDTIPVFTPEEGADLMRRTRFPDEIKADGSHFTDRWLGTRTRGDPDWSLETVHIGVTTFFMNGPWREDSFDAAFTYDLMPDIKQITCPTLAVFGKTDPIYSHRERLRTLRPDFEFDEFPRASAMILEQPDLWTEKMAAFLKSPSLE